MPSERAALSARSIFGLAVVVVGVLLTLDNLGLVDSDDFWQYWPAIFLLIGVAKLSSGEVGRGLFWLALGAAFLLPMVFEGLDWEDLFDYWPLFLIAFGVYLVARSFPPRTAGRGSLAAEPAPREADDDFQATAILSSVRRTVSSASFRRADLTAVMGGCDVDLTAAELAPQGAVIEVLAFWGGVTLRIPDHWQVDPQLAVIMGSLEDHSGPQPRQAGPRQAGPRQAGPRQAGPRQAGPRQASGGRLTIRGVALMGGLEIRR